MYIRVIYSKKTNKTYYVLYVYDKANNGVSRLVDKTVYEALKSILPVYDVVNKRK